MPFFTRDRPIYAVPRPTWKYRGDYRFSLVLALASILLAFGHAYLSRLYTSRHDPDGAQWHQLLAYPWLAIGIGWAWKSYRAYRRRP